MRPCCFSSPNLFRHRPMDYRNLSSFMLGIRLACHAFDHQVMCFLCRILLTIHIWILGSYTPLCKDIFRPPIGTLHSLPNRADTLHLSCTSRCFGDVLAPDNPCILLRCFVAPHRTFLFSVLSQLWAVATSLGIRPTIAYRSFFLQSAHHQLPLSIGLPSQPINAAYQPRPSTVTSTTRSRNFRTSITAVSKRLHPALHGSDEASRHDPVITFSTLASPSHVHILCCSLTTFVGSAVRLERS